MMPAPAVVSRLEPRLLRDAFGTFATGVTIVTAVDADGAPMGLTVSSFASLSIDPPLVTWSLRSAAVSRARFEAAARFAVNVLKDDQHALALRFSRPHPARFDGVQYTLSERGLPLIEGALAHFECQRMRQVEGGDHLLFIGAVERVNVAHGQPLVFWRSGFMRGLGTHA